MKEIFQLLNRLGYTVSCCESVTAGLFMSRMAEVSGISQVLKGGIVSYWTEIKQNVVGIDQNLISEFGVVSFQCSEAMASSIQKMFDTNVAVSFTGNAGPGTLENKPAGLIYTTIRINDEFYNFEDMISGSRNEIRSEIVDKTAERLKNFLRNISSTSNIV